MSNFQIASLAVLALIYGGSGLIELPQWRKFADQFVRWGFPPWFAAFNPVLKIIAAGLALAPATRVYGVALCVFIALGAGLTVLRFKERAMYKAALPVVVLTLVSATLMLA